MVLAIIIIVILSYFMIGYVSLGTYILLSSDEKRWNDITYIFWLWPIALFMNKKKKKEEKK